MDFKSLVENIQHTHTSLQQSAVKAINKHITIRNWLIGFYIVEYEQNGEDRAAYGENILVLLAKKLEIKGLSNTNERELRRYRLFYKTYSQLAGSFSHFLSTSVKRGTVSPVFSLPQIRGTASPELQKTELHVPPDNLLNRLSYSHFSELLNISDSLKRTFYELECIKGNWSVRELQRQINSLYFERSGLSKNPKKLSAMIAENAEPMQAIDVVKSVYTFEFLGLKAKDVIEETDLETALLDHLQDFMLEMGHGFCLEARQKKILIGDEYFFVDLVFYHRILKCHILLELKIEKFNHINAGQLNTYLNYYKNDALVQYATAGMDDNLFVSKYLVELPSKQQLEEFVKNELRRL